MNFLFKLKLLFFIFSVTICLQIVIMKTQTICILLAIVIVLILGYVAFNEGKLWNKEYYGDKPGCSYNYQCNTGFYCDLQTYTPPHGQCKKK